jgi:hypothetical protein
MERKGKAVSESIGYLIIFSLVLTGIGLITLYGYPLLMQQQSSANMRNMEQTMIVLQNDIKSLTYKLANYKETSLRVSGGTLSLYGPPNTPQRFVIQQETAGGFVFSPPPLGELRYFSPTDNTVIVLENGAVIEKPLTQTGSFMLADPRWYLDNSTGLRTLVINFMNLSSTPGSNQLLSQTGVGTVRMRLARANMTTQDWVPADNATITYYPSNTATIMPDGYARAWKNYLTNTNNFDGGMVWSAIPGADVYTSVQKIDRIVIKEYDIVVETL